ncbi:hypothetical protein CLAIMM_04680 [Cladophialophora immunda]|nr:hypothetical protein CLAIMM_04680 [Cladophialophora immunda]
MRHILKRKASFDRIVVFTSHNTVKTKPGEIAKLEQEGVEIVLGDLSNTEEVARAFQDVDTVISAVGRNMIEHQIELIRIADKTPNIHRFFPSEYGTDIEYSPRSASEKPHQKKLRVRAALRSCKNLDYTFLVTGPYANGEPGLYFSANYGAKHAGSFDVKAKTAFLIGDGNLKISFTTMNDVGKLVVLALLHPEASRNKALRVNSFTATDAQILAEFEKQLGGESFRVSYTGLKELKRLENEAWHTSNPLATLITLRRIWAEGGTLYEGRDNAVIEGGDVVETLEDAVADAVMAQMQREQDMKRKLV